MGLDISAKMLEVARKENSSPNIHYVNKSTTDLNEITETFDVVFSLLPFITLKISLNWSKMFTIT